MLVHLAHVLYHSISVLLVGADQRADALRVSVRIWLHVAYLGEVVLRTVDGVHRRVDQLRRAVHSLLDAALMAVILWKPLVLRRNGALRFAIEAADLLLFLVVHVLVRKVAKEGLLGTVFVKLLRGRVRLREVAYLLVVRNDDSFGLELRSTLDRDALVGDLVLYFQLLIWVYLGIHL